MAVSEAGEDVKLLGHWASIFVTRVSIALKLKGIAHEFLEEVIGSNGELAKSGLLLSSNPVYKKIPVLLHRGKPVCESMIIVQYIDEAWAATGPSILPSDAHERAVARFWSAFIDEWIFKMFVMLRAKTEEEKAEAAERTIAGLHLLEKAFKECSKGQRFFGGDAIGYLDIALGCNLGWMEAFEELCGIKLLEESKTPQLVGWAERFWADDAVKGVMPEAEKYAEFGKMARARRNAQPAN